MPTRYIRDNYLDSNRVNSLDAEAERFYFRLLLCVDDYGLIRATPTYLSARVFPLTYRGVEDIDIDKWLHDCELADLLQSYENLSTTYLQVFRTGFRVRAAKSKCPLPPWGIESAFKRTPKDNARQFDAANMRMSDLCPSSVRQMPAWESHVASVYDYDYDYDSSIIARARGVDERGQEGRGKEMERQGNGERVEKEERVGPGRRAWKRGREAGAGTARRMLEGVGPNGLAGARAGLVEALAALWREHGRLYLDGRARAAGWDGVSIGMARGVAGVLAGWGAQ